MHTTECDRDCNNILKPFLNLIDFLFHAHPYTKLVDDIPFSVKKLEKLAQVGFELSLSRADTELNH